MTKKESKEQPDEHSRPSAAPTLKEQTSDIDRLAENLPPEILEILYKIFEKAGEDPAKMSLFAGKIKWSSYRGDLPPAEIIGEYEKAYPGSGSWLLDRIATQSNKRLEIAQLQAQGQEDRANRSQWLGFGVAVVGIAVSGIAHIWTGSWLFPSILAVAAIGGPSGVPILARAFHRYLGTGDEKH
ncbi:MAG: hypothetical protein ACLPX9_12485 [Rhodomicrobium sp.]